MASLRSSHPRIGLFLSHPPPSARAFKPHRSKNLHSRTTTTKAFLADVSSRVTALHPRSEDAIRCSNPERENELVAESDRPPFDINLAVVLAGFAFEAYSSPPENVGMREIDASDCQTVFLSEMFLREVYDGQLFIKLKNGVDFPAMDPWGTSDPYVIIQLDGQVAKSNVKWATKDPIWNENFNLNVKRSRAKNLQIAVWDANLVTPHKRMGNAGVNLEFLCDGILHELVVELEGIGGGGKIHLEVKYNFFDEIDEEKQSWRIPFVSDFLMKSSLGSALRVVLGSESVNARQFVESAFGQLKSFNYDYLRRVHSSNDHDSAIETSGKNLNVIGGTKQFLQQEKSSEGDLSADQENSSQEFPVDTDGRKTPMERQNDESLLSDEFFWKNLADAINYTVLQKIGFSIPETLRWDKFDLLNKISIQSQKVAEEEFVESGLATPRTRVDVDSKNAITNPSNEIQSSFFDIRKASQDLLGQTDNILGALMVLTATLPQQKNDASPVVGHEKSSDSSSTGAGVVTRYPMNETGGVTLEGSALERGKTEEMKALFSTAESAMEAWAMLATSLGRTSFIKSEFEKICFLDNVATDTQVAIWRDTLRRRLVIAFRGTEQARWKDLRTDLMLVPAGLNPERLGGDFKQEVQVHSGFLGAYDSVRNRIMTLIKLSIGYFEDGDMVNFPKWHLYVTGHSLGGALATLLAFELSTSRMSKCSAISVTMYNFGSPRVGNRRFAEVYNEKVKDSWRIVNHRDIIPTVPRLMGYCHVAQPVYLAAGDLRDSMVNMELFGDGYEGDVIGESTPDVLVNEFIKGEMQLIEKILQTEINLFRSIRDGTALMQHMEDFYYVTLLEGVRSNYKTVENLGSNENDSSLTA